MVTYSFRAECSKDVANFLALCKEKLIHCTNISGFADDAFPDVEVQLECEADLETLRNVIREVVDGHVMLETLKAVPIEQNNMKRDYQTWKIAPD